VSELSHEPLLQQFPDAEWDEAAGAVIAPLGQARTVAEWLLGQGVDYCSNVTGVDYLEREVKEKITNDAGEVETVTRTEPGRIDVVYHLYSMQNKTGPLVLKQRTTREALLDQHRAVNDALQARDPAGARAAVEAHLDYVEAALSADRKAERDEDIARQRYERVRTRG